MKINEISMSGVGVCALAFLAAVSATAHPVALPEPSPEPLPGVAEWADTTVTLGEVGVTAIKTTTELGRLPLASTVVGEHEVERLNITTIKGMSELAPNFYVPDYGSRMTSSVYVRGIGARIDQPVVGMNVDNVPYLNKNNFDFDLADVERIELLRGPQSTLYGRNTIGGLINIYTLSPLRVQGLRALLEYGSRNSIRAGLSYYGRITPTLGMSVSVNYAHTDGYFRNLYNGQKCDAENQGSLRWKTVWQPSASLSIENTASAQIVRQGGYPYASYETGLINYSDTCFYRRNSFADGLTVQWRVGNVALSSITSLQYLDDNMTLDQDFLPADYFTLTQHSHEWAVTQDFIAKGTAGKHYSWLGGLFGFHKHTSMWAPVVFKQTGIKELILSKIPERFNPTWQSDEFLLGSDFSNPVEGGAIYHQSTWKQSAWTFTLGMRLDVEHTALTYNSRCNTGMTMNIPAGPVTIPYTSTANIDESGHMSKTFVEFLPKFAATYSFGSTGKSNVYASVARGYKSGGYNTQMFSDILQQKMMGEMIPANVQQMLGMSVENYDVDEVISYRPEQSWNYEVGTHLNLLGGALTFDGTLFYILCRDQQLTVFPEGSQTGRRMTNAGRTRSFGGELSARWVATDALSLNASYGYTNARFRNYRSGDADYRGNRIPYAPENTLFAGADYRICVNNNALNDVIFNVNCRGVGSIMWNDENTVKQPFYALLGASVTFENENYALTLWGENLTATQYDTFYFVSINNAFVQRGKPIHYGATLRLKF
jgi:outer membrane receptor protein involved in Fe transport